MLNKIVTIPKAQYINTVIAQGNRNVGLDVARALCAIIVVVSHTNNYMGHFTGAYRFIFPVGYMIQDLFFGLSGYLVGSQIVKQINNNGTVSKLFNFYKNRWIRTIPFYIIFLLINYAVFYYVYQHSSLNFFNNDFKLADYTVFSQNLFSAHPSFFPEIWPLPIEEWSFLLLPLPILLLAWLLKKPLSKNQLIVLLLIELAITNYIRIDHILNNDLQTDWQLRKIVLYRLDALIYGFLVSILVDRFPEFFMKHKTRLLIAGFVICFVFYFSGNIIGIKLYQSLLFLLLPLFMSLTIPFFFFKKFELLPNGLTAMLTHLSLISYSVLLSHLYLIQFSLLNIYMPTNFPEGVAFTLIYFTILLVFATGFFNFIERPVLLRRKKKI